MSVRLPSIWDLPEEIKNRFGQKGVGRQRAMVANDQLLLVLHKAPKPDQQKRESVFFWRKANGEWEYSDKGAGLFSLRKHIEEFSVAAEKFNEEYKQAQTAEDYFQILEDMTPLHHAAKNLHTTLQAAREGIPDDRDIIDLRDWAYNLERTLDLLYLNTKNALDFSMARKAEEQARSGQQSVQTAHRLNVLAAIFFPLTAITSVFGMSLRSGLENAPTLLFWLIFLAGVILGFITRQWVLKK